ncbi:MAG: 4-(cytidine 5'-diphospho)-2-C-methyl-D-erythritol kinase [Cryomorphaceae bacterium]|jgi:4-diphosphocytidyl-2-C-methyl-D-erythritol kinase|nr:4-(cytidine 5'-diphospho)-2-C-methyl-D-erythritol kinase [Cryomorphaceae bacterium]
MIFFPPAKINLGLKVRYKREDGYHELDTCMVPIPLYDVLEILPSVSFSFRQTGLTFDGADQYNLCIKAYQLLSEEFDLPPVYMHLRKIIPMGAGLGGGSSDAAWTLIGLNKLFNLNIHPVKLEQYASILGSDCPFFIQDTIQLAEGRGEVLTPFDLSFSGKYIKIVNPGIHIGTAEAYASVNLTPSGPSPKELLNSPVYEWKRTVTNDFEPGTFRKYPEIEKIKQQLYDEGAFFALMSGSGSTVYGLFEDEPESTFEGTAGFLERIRQFPVKV